MDLAYLLSRHQNASARAGTAACVASRASHRALAAAYGERLRAFRLARDITDAA